MTKEDLLEMCVHSTLHMHHSALIRGYQSVKEKRCVFMYVGKFGSGYVLHVPTKVSACSNSYHRIYYLIF